MLMTFFSKMQLFFKFQKIVFKQGQKQSMNDVSVLNTIIQLMSAIFVLIEIKR